MRSREKTIVLSLEQSRKIIEQVFTENHFKILSWFEKAACPLQVKKLNGAILSEGAVLDLAIDKHEYALGHDLRKHNIWREPHKRVHKKL